MGPTLQELEARPNWIATFKSTNPEATEPYDCLMQNMVGGYYWHTPDYRGLCAGCATRTFYADLLADELALGLVRLVRGTLPSEVVQRLKGAV